MICWFLGFTWPMRGRFQLYLCARVELVLTQHSLKSMAIIMTTFDPTAAHVRLSSSTLIFHPP